jgi:AcrR family transcriptional regulator
MTRQRSDEQRKRQIRAAATRCFVRKGYASTRLLDIAREAGLSKGGVYFHYRAKEQLFHDIIDTHLQTLHERWGFEPAADRPAADTLARLVTAHLRTLEDEPDETRLFSLLVTMAVQDAAFRNKLDELFSIMRSLYASVIERGMNDGSFTCTDAEAAATTIMATVNGYAAYGAVHAEGKLPAASEHVADMVLAQIGAKAPAASTGTNG